MRTCPQCNGALNATATVTLYDVDISDGGEIVRYEGGPLPRSAEDVLDMVNESNPTITCVNAHVVDPLA